MTIRSYLGLDQADDASLGFGGAFYTCVVGLNRSKNQVEGVVVTRGESGQKVNLDLGPVRAASAIGANTVPDCPRVLAMPNVARFIAHWIEIEEEGATTLHRAVFNVGNIAAGWVYLGNVTIHDSALYDACEISGQSTSDEFIVVRRSLVNQIVTARYQNSWGWAGGSVVFAVASSVTIADRVLAVTADDTDDATIINYQQASLLNTLRLNASDGLGPALVECFADVLDGDNQFTAVASVRASANSYWVFAEVANDADIAPAGAYAYVRSVAYRAVRGTDATPQNNSQWLYNVHLACSPWTWSSGQTNEVELYCALSFKSLTDGQEFVQSYGYVARIDRDTIEAGADAGTVYPIPVAAFMDGSFDGRAHAFSPANITPVAATGARLNHVSNVSGPPLHTLGPEAKSVSFAHTRYSRLIGQYDPVAGGTTGQDQELLPASTKLSLITFHHEPQVMIRRFADEPTQPDTPAWRGIPRAAALPQAVPGLLVFGGGLTQVYEGYQLVELGFLWYPEIISSTINEDMGSNLVVGDYWYAATYAWTDIKGQLHRSPPSVPFLVQITTASDVDLELRCMNLSMKDDLARYPAASSISIELWRTRLSGGDIVTSASGEYLFRRLFANSNSNTQRLQDTPESDKTAFSVTTNDDVADDDLAFQELLPYQLDTSTLQWTPSPPSPHVPIRAPALWQSRLFGYGHDDRALRWSEQITTLGTQYVASEFLDANRFLLDDVGEVVASASMDNGLFVFTRTGVQVLRGDPGANGTGISLDLDTIPGAPGCLEPRSVVVAPPGIFYQSPRGIYAIGRETGVSNVGAPVEDLVREAGNLRGGVVLEDRHQIRWLYQALPGTGPLAVRPRILIYDYRQDLWCTATLPMLAQSTSTSRLNEMMHSAVWPGRQGEHLHVVLAQGAIATERADDDTAYTDVGAAGTVAIPLDITTNWLHVQMGQTRRIYEIEVITERLNTSPLTIEAWYDLDGTWDSDDGAAQQTLTIASPPETIRFRPRPSKCRGIKLRIYESATVAQTENVRFIALRLHFGLKTKQQGLRNSA